MEQWLNYEAQLKVENALASTTQMPSETSGTPGCGDHSLNKTEGGRDESRGLRSPECHLMRPP